MGLGISAGTAAAIAGGVGAAASVAGAGMSYIGSQNASRAAADANNQAMWNQNQAFMARNAAQQAQTQEQAAAQNQGQAEYLRQEQAMRSGQSEALRQKAIEVGQMNAAEQAIADRTKAQVQQTTEQAVSPEALQQAQAQSEAQRVAAVQPTVQDIRASDPTAPTAGSATKSAMAEEMARASKYTEQYGANLARLGSYSAIPATTNIASKELAMQLMPSASADQLLKAGASARLLPSSVAYQNATNLGQSRIASNTQQTQDLMGLSKMREQNAADLATLNQQDTNANIQTGLNYAQARAASLKALGSGVQAVGNAAITYGASKGAFSDLFGSGTPTVSSTQDPYAGYVNQPTATETPAIQKYNF